MRLRESWKDYKESFYPDEMIKVLNIEDEFLIKHLEEENREYLERIWKYKTDITKMVNLLQNDEIFFKHNDAEKAFFHLIEQTHFLLDYCEKKEHRISIIKEQMEQERRVEYNKINVKIDDVIVFIEKLYGNKYESHIEFLKSIKIREKAIYISKKKVFESFYIYFTALMQDPLTSKGEKPRTKIRNIVNKIIKEYFGESPHNPHDDTNKPYFSKDVDILKYKGVIYNTESFGSTKHTLYHFS